MARFSLTRLSGAPGMDEFPTQLVRCVLVLLQAAWLTPAVETISGTLT